MSERKKLTVQDLDPVIEGYEVTSEHGRTIGEKSRAFGYLKPEYGKNGRRVGGRYGSVSERVYKANPPWLKYEVIKVEVASFRITIRTKGDK